MKKINVLIVALFAFSLTLAAQEDGTFLDERDGREYHWVKIGEQVWMVEDLLYLPSVNPATEGSETEPCYYVYLYKGTNTQEAKASKWFEEYSVMYNWAAAKTACPKGWHIPSSEEWEKLAQFVSDSNGGYSKIENRWENVGKHLKSIFGWTIIGGTDDYHFMGYTGWTRTKDGIFSNSGYCNMWSSTPYLDKYYKTRTLSGNNQLFRESSERKDSGVKIRCLKD